MPYFRPILGLEIFEREHKKAVRLNTIQHSTSSRSNFAHSQAQELSRRGLSEMSDQVTENGLSLPPVRSPTSQEYFTFKPHYTSKRYGELTLTKLFKMVTDKEKLMNSYLSPTNVQKPLTDSSKI